MNSEVNNEWMASLVSRAKEVAQKLEERIQELLDDGKGPPSSAAPSDPAAIQFG